VGTYFMAMDGRGISSRIHFQVNIFQLQIRKISFIFSSYGYFFFQLDRYLVKNRAQQIEQQSFATTTG
jgi:hypothetical protein